MVNHKILLPAYSLILLLMSETIIAQSAANCTVKIEVREKGTGTPVPNALILEHQTTIGKTNASGISFLPGRNAGFTLYRIVRNGYIARDMDLTVSPDTTVAPPIMMDSERSVEDALATELKKYEKDVDVGKVLYLYKTLQESYQVNDNKQALDRLQKTAQQVNIISNKRPA